MSEPLTITVTLASEMVGEHPPYTLTLSPEALDALADAIVGTGNFARKYRKAYCKRGHARTQENLYTYPGSGYQACKLCRYEKYRKLRQKQLKDSAK